MSKTSTAIWHHVYYGRPIERLLLQCQLQGGRGLELPSITQLIATVRTAAYHVGANICLF